MVNRATDWLPRLMALGADKRLPMLATLAVILLLAQSLAALTWALLPAPAVEGLPPAPNPGARRTVAGTPVVANMAQWHLFGEVQKEAPTPLQPAVDAPDTSLNLKLHGVLASKNPAVARAIISDGKAVEEAYAVNGNLPGGAILREIHADRVILEYRGRLEALRLPKESIEGATDDVMRGSRQPSALPGVAPAGGDTSGLLRQYRDALTNNPASVMDLVRAEPVMDEASGQLKGYRLGPGKDRQLLGRFGLRPGDVVTSVNGVPLDNPIKALEILRDITGASQVSLEVERNGVSQSFAFQID
jgi:general secretion pathway protein C